jgi:uncharacterized protein
VRHLIEITAADVEDAGLAVDQVLPSDWITAQGEDAEARATKDGHFVGRISRSGRADMVVRGVVTATVEVPCARCLKPTPIDVRGELSLFLKPNAALAKPSAAAKTKGKAKAKLVTEAPAQAVTPKIPSRRDDPRASKSEKGKTARIAEYEFSSEEADTDEYDGETIVLDPFVREAILLELPNFPLCSESCAGISPGLAASRADALGASGNASSAGASAIRANPFEALKHLVRGLPNKSDSSSADSTNSSKNGSHGQGLNGSPEAALSSKKARAEAKFASSHSAPIRRGSSKRAAARGKVVPKKTTKH